MAKKEDRRIQKSRKTIKKAFIELLDEKGFGNISVHDIAEKADISRGIFICIIRTNLTFLKNTWMNY